MRRSYRYEDRTISSSSLMTGARRVVSEGSKYTFVVEALCMRNNSEEKVGPLCEMHHDLLFQCRALHTAFLYIATNMFLPLCRISSKAAVLIAELPIQ